VKRRAFLAAPLVLAAARAQGAEPYPRVLPGGTLAFPRDHGAHPAYRTEWWYITGWVADRDGYDLGVQVTFFRNRPNVAEDNPSAFAPQQLIFAHAAIAQASHGRLRHDQRAARAVFELAGAAEQTTRVWLGDWSLILDGDVYRARVAARDFALALDFRATQAVLLQGDGGYSRKGPLPEQASWYYSRPQLDATGRVDIGGQTREVSGRAWLDHEWSSEYMAEGAVGWDWTGINLDDGGALMAFRMRSRDGRTVWTGGARRDASGATETLRGDAVRFVPGRRWTSPRTSITYPVEFTVRAGGVDYSLMPLMDDQELDSSATTGTVYWEGAVRVSRDGRPVGRGYLELTGYGGSLKI
jgi:predicted secreted hydrolase